MKTIKTRSSIKGLKVLDKSIPSSKRMKDTLIRSKGRVRESQEAGEPQNTSPAEYATSHTQSSAGETVRRFSDPFIKTRENWNRAKGNFQVIKHNLPKERKQAAEQAQKTAQKAKDNAERLRKTANQAKDKAQEAKIAVTDANRVLRETRQIKSTETPAKLTETGAKRFKDNAKGTVKVSKKTVKSAEQSAKAAVKTAKQTAKTAKHSARAASKTAKAAEKAARATSRAAARSAKSAARAVVAMVKIATAALRGLIALVTAGGFIAVMVVLIICLIGLLVGSVFGIFFSGENAGTGRTMPSVISELTTEFYEQVDQIKDDNPHDVFEMDAMAIYWPDVLAVYAVKVSTDPSGTEVATLDDGKVEILRSVLHDMVSLSYYLRTDTFTNTVSDGNGGETTETETIITLVITLVQKTVEEMTAHYGFSSRQTAQTDELLSPEFSYLWAGLLGGYIPGNGEILIGSTIRLPNNIFSWPLENNYPITSGYGYRKDPFTGEISYHSGIDIGAPGGTLILAAADGTVTYANGTDSWGGSYGYYVKIQHEGGYVTLYAHASTIVVVGGQEVKKGQVIAYVGNTGRSTNNHLHWEVYKDGGRKDPLEYFN